MSETWTPHQVLSLVLWVLLCLGVTTVVVFLALALLTWRKK